MSHTPHHTPNAPNHTEIPRSFIHTHTKNIKKERKRKRDKQTNKETTKQK
jgi:hypothetical protein